MITLISCSLSRKEIRTSDYCDLYLPLSDYEMDSALLSYWKQKITSIKDKNLKGLPKTEEERFIELTTNIVATNDRFYYQKGCDINKEQPKKR